MTEADRQALVDAGIPVDGYSLSQLDIDLQNIKPRFLDTWILPGLMMWYAYNARKKGMGKITSRLLFGGGMYMAYRNYSKYRKAVLRIASIIESQKGGNGESPDSANA